MELQDPDDVGGPREGEKMGKLGKRCVQKTRDSARMSETIDQNTGKNLVMRSRI